MKKIICAAKAAFFPKTCVACGKIIPEQDWLCADCRKAIRRCHMTSRCKVCGLPKKNCACKSRIFRFEGCVAPFVNTEIARNAMLRYKYRDYKTIARFFAEQMAASVQKEYADIAFDGICYVPMHKRKQLQRGLHPAKLLAECVSERLNIPVESDLLCCMRYTKKPQHQLSFQGRQENVRNLYRATYEVEGKTLLLIDDIKTSGFTLDECAKQLLNAGASAIWCVTALITYPKPRDKRV